MIMMTMTFLVMGVSYFDNGDCIHGDYDDYIHRFIQPKTLFIIVEEDF